MNDVDIPGPPILLSDHYAGARVFSLDALLDQLPNTQVFNATRSGECLFSDARLVSLLSIARGRLTRGSRKEVIQPQVPLRLPCYDFAPVTELAFGGSLPQAGWVTDFGRSRLPWRDGRCVQGPGTYSPWCS